MAQRKELAGAYGSAIIGLLLGVLGMHRFYLRHYISAALMTLIFVAGLFLFVKEIVVQYQALLGQLVDSLSAGATVQSIPNIEQHLGQSQRASNTVIASILCGIGVVWWLVDLFLLPGMVEKYNAAQKY